MSSIRLNSAGYIYALTNPAMGQTDAHGITVYLIKVGATTLSPFERARQLTAATASPLPFHVAHYRPVRDVNAAEARCHELLAGYRMNDGREFFSAPLSEVIRVMDQVAGVVDQGPARLYPFAALFATFEPDGPDQLTEDEQRQCRELEARLAARASLARDRGAEEWREAA